MLINRRKLRRTLGTRVGRRRGTKSSKPQQKRPRVRLAEMIQKIQAQAVKKQPAPPTPEVQPGGELVVIPPSDGIDIVQPK